MSSPPADRPQGGSGVGAAAAAGSRVLVIAPQPFYQDRGTPIALKHVLEALAELGAGCDLVTFPLGESPDLPGVRYFRAANPFGFRAVPIGFSLRKLILDLMLIPVVLRRLRRERYACVHAVEEGAFLAALLCRRRGIPLVYDMQSSLPEQLEQSRLFRLAPVRALARRLERWLLSRADRVACSAGLARHARAVAPGADPVEWYFPTERFEAGPREIKDLARELRVPPGARVVLYSGSFEPYQGLPLLLRAMPEVLARVPEAFFVLVGATEAEYARLLRLEAIAPLAADRVRVVPRQRRDRIGIYLALAEVLVSPRSYGDNIPLKAFDYMATGRPMVATDIPAHRAVLDGSRAVLVEPSAGGLADGIAALLTDPELAARVVAGARAFHETRLSWPAFVRTVGGLYAGFLGGGPGRSG